MTDAQTTYDRAAYDKDHERALLEAIKRTIFESFMLVGILAMSPAAIRSPTAIRRTLIDDLGKRLRRQIAAAEASEDLQEFISRTFRGNDVEGTA